LPFPVELSRIDPAVDKELAGRYHEQLKSVVERASRNALLWFAALLVIWTTFQQAACNARSILDRQQENYAREAAWLEGGDEVAIVARATDPALIASKEQVRRDTADLDEIELPGFRLKIPRVWTPLVWAFAALGLLAYLANRRRRILLLCVKTLTLHQSSRGSPAQSTDDLVGDVPWWVAPLPVRVMLGAVKAADLNAALGCDDRRQGMAVGTLTFLCVVSVLAVIVLLDSMVFVSLLSQSRLETILVPSLTAFACWGIWSLAREWLRPFSRKAIAHLEEDYALRAPRWMVHGAGVIGCIALAFLVLNEFYPIRYWLAATALRLSDYRAVSALIAVTVGGLLLASAWFAGQWWKFRDVHIAGRPPAHARTQWKDAGTIGAFAVLAGAGFVAADVLAAAAASRANRRRTNTTRKTSPSRVVQYAQQNGLEVNGESLLAGMQFGRHIRQSRQPFFSPKYVLGAAALGAAADARGRMRASPGPNLLRLSRRRWAQLAALLAAGLVAGPALGWRRAVLTVRAAGRRHRKQRARLTLKTGDTFPTNTLLRRVQRSVVHYVHDGVTIAPRKTPVAPTILDVRRLSQLGVPSTQAGAAAQVPWTGGLTTITIEELLQSKDFHVNLANASVSLEHAALHQLRTNNDVELAKRILILAIGHDARYKTASRGRPSLRLYDLLAGLHVRAAKGQTDAGKNPAAELLERQRDTYRNDPYVTQQISARVQKWSDPDGLWYRCWADRTREVKWAGETIMV
jgi:hypothetical protein